MLFHSVTSRPRHTSVLGETSGLGKLHLDEVGAQRIFNVLPVEFSTSCRYFVWRGKSVEHDRAHVEPGVVHIPCS